MSNMAQMIMEGASIGSAKLNHHYDHETGAALIAMESAEALNAIFEDVFYIPNTCTIAAAMEGATCVEESSQAAIMEAALKGAFAKIKQFFIDLKEKVKEFLHNIKRYLLGVFGNDEKWIKQYEKDLNALSASDLKDYKVKMYNYTIDSALSADALATGADKMIAETEKQINSIKASSHGAKENDDIDDELKEVVDKTYTEFISTLCGKKVDEDEFDKEIWSKMRDGADNEGDKDDVDVAGKKSAFIAALKSSTKDVAAYDKCISKTDSMYQKAIKTVDKAQKDFENLKTDDNGVAKEGDNMYGAGARQAVSASLRALSSSLSKMQTAENKAWNAAKSALVERNGVYKKALVGAFAYAKKNKK